MERCLWEYELVLDLYIKGVLEVTDLARQEY